MYDLIISVVVLLTLMFVESKRIEISKKFGEENSFFKSFTNNFQIIRFIFIPLMFVSIFMFFYIVLIENELVILNYQNFKLSHIPYIMYSIITIPIIEEYFYRFCPYSFKKFNNVMMYVIVLLVSSLIFTYAHRVGNYESILIFVIAISFSIIYLLSRNISYTIISHSLFNLIVLIYGYINIGYKIIYLVIFGISLIILVINSKIKRKL